MTVTGLAGMVQVSFAWKHPDLSEFRGETPKNCNRLPLAAIWWPTTGMAGRTDWQSSGAVHGARPAPHSFSATSLTPSSVPTNRTGSWQWPVPSWQFPVASGQFPVPVASSQFPAVTSGQSGPAQQAQCFQRACSRTVGMTECLPRRAVQNKPMADWTVDSPVRPPYPCSSIMTSQQSRHYRMPDFLDLQPAAK
jgi:hypothetical protein